MSDYRSDSITVLASALMRVIESKGMKPTILVVSVKFDDGVVVSTNVTSDGSTDPSKVN